MKSLRKSLVVRKSLTFFSPCGAMTLLHGQSALAYHIAVISLGTIGERLSKALSPKNFGDSFVATPFEIFFSCKNNFF
uniref:Putative secreted protein n=1 Tax=Lutzomyia longipalpis TaxID=7200 RepID=A0A7G3AP29_LUTLO